MKLNWKFQSSEGCGYFLEHCQNANKKMFYCYFNLLFINISMTKINYLVLFVGLLKV